MRCYRYAAQQGRSNTEDDEPCFGDEARTLSSLVIDVDNLCFGVKVNHFVPNLPSSVAAFFDAAKWHMRIAANSGAIDVNDAGLCPLSETKDLTDIASEHRRRESVSNRISNLKRFVETLDSNDGYNWTKDLFLSDCHLLLSFKHRWRKEEASSQSALSQLISAGAKARALRATYVHPLSDTSHRTRIDQRSQLNPRLGSRSNFHRPRAIDKSAHEVIVDFVHNQRPAGCSATLSG